MRLMEVRDATEAQCATLGEHHAVCLRNHTLIRLYSLMNLLAQQNGLADG